MKVFGSRPKGAKAERVVGAFYAAWWQPVEPGCVFVRTPGSGAWGRGKERAGFRASGDLATTALLFPWVVEVKHREEVHFPNFLAGKAGPAWDYWVQSCQAASEAEEGMCPILILRKNRIPWHVVVHHNDRLCRLRKPPPTLAMFPIHRGDHISTVKVFLLADVLAVPPHLLARNAA